MHFDLFFLADLFLKVSLLIAPPSWPPACWLAGPPPPGT